MNIIRALIVAMLYSHDLAFGKNSRQENHDERLDETQSSSIINQKQYRGNERHGPVIFPENPEDNAEMNSNRYITIARKHNIKSDNKRDGNYAYPKIVKKYREKKSERFTDYEDDSSFRLHEALAKHGAKVLRVPPEKLGKDHIPLSRETAKKNNYAFFYKVVDQLTGDDFSHSQTRNSRVTNGEYRVKLPDGRLQIVSYRADKDGYKADVRYTENDAAQFRVAHRDAPIQIHREVQPIPRRLGFSGQSDATAKLNALNARRPTATPQSYDDYEDNLVSPSPAGRPVAVDGNFQVPVPINVKIYTSNARDYNVGSYIPFISSTMPYHKDIDDYQRDGISPHIINNGNHGIVVPAPTPSSFILTDQYGQVIDNIRLVTSTASPLVTASTPSFLYRGHRGPFIALSSTAATPAVYKK